MTTYINCKRCNKKIKRNSGNHKYCKECSLLVHRRMSAKNSKIKKYKRRMNMFEKLNKEFQNPIFIEPMEHNLRRLEIIDKFKLSRYRSQIRILYSDNVNKRLVIQIIDYEKGKEYWLRSKKDVKTNQLFDYINKNMRDINDIIMLCRFGNSKKSKNIKKSKTEIFI